MSTDAIVLLRDDHKEMRRLFREFQSAGTGAHSTKGRVVDQILEMLTVHTYLENTVLYPRVMALLPDLTGDLLESYEEHHVADLLCSELAALAPDAERFDAKTTVLIENVEHHIQEEEKGWFPKVREALSRSELQSIGQEMLDLRPAAPRHPAQPGALKKAVQALIH